MFCPKCSRSFDDSMKFCTEDGSKLVSIEEDTMMADASEATMISTEGSSAPPPASAAIEIRVRDPLRPRELRVGDTIGMYRLEEQLGQGGMATVYRATQQSLGKPVAIKILHPKLPKESAAAERFIQEARIINQIHHRNIVDILEFNQLPDGRHYLVMEYLNGVTLQRYQAQHPTLKIPAVLKIVKAVASALDAAHAKGCIHRDLKPENILIERPESLDHMLIRLVDFGAAKLVVGEDDEEEHALQTKTGIILGTPDYMSPEQCDAGTLDHRTDIYSLGMVAFQCLTGSLPFQSTNLYEAMAMRLTRPPPTPTQVAPQLHPAFNAPLLKSLAKNPDDRYQTAGEFAYALEVAAYEAARAAQQAGLTSAEELAAMVPSSAPTPSQVMSALPRRTTQVAHPGAATGAVQVPSPAPAPQPVLSPVSSVRPPTLQSPDPAAQAGPPVGIVAGVAAAIVALGVIAWLALS